MNDYFDKQYDNLPPGITQNEKNEYIWEGECKASSYKAIFTACRWIIGILGLIALVIVCIFSGNQIVSSLLITAGIILFVYAISAGCLIVLRDGRFRAKMTLTKDYISVKELELMPESGFAIIVSLIVGFFSLIGSIYVLFSDNSVTADQHANPHDKSVYRSASYKKIKEITLAPDKKRIILKKGVGKLIVLVTLEQCDFVVKEIEYRRKVGK